MHPLFLQIINLFIVSFHDCIRYEDGKGGCDGCLNWSGVGDRYPAEIDPYKFKFKFDDLNITNNNGLEYTVAILEELYTDPTFPPRTPELPASLKATGKSR